jgi:hypothetical protein
MFNVLKKIYFWCYLKIYIILMNIGIMIYRAEVDAQADPNDIKEGDKKIQRMLHRNQTLEKFYAGKTDEKYVREYYEILKKADRFIRTATPYQMAIAADKHGSSYAQADPTNGRRYEHFGFYDEKHKHAGKTIGEVLVQEYEERRLKDDDYELLGIYNNEPIEVGLAKVMNVVKKIDENDLDSQYEVKDMTEKSKTFEFPIKIVRENENVVNKIEQLTEFLHIKKIGFDYRQLEFLIPLKFKTSNYDEDTDVFKELINIKEVFLRNDYGELTGYGIMKFIKRIQLNNTHDVFKFEAIEMQNMKI